MGLGRNRDGGGGGGGVSLPFLAKNRDTEKLWLRIFFRVYPASDAVVNANKPFSVTDIC